MGSHRHSDRRQFLTESAALASIAVGAVQSAGAQTSPEARLKDTLAYGQPSRFDNTLRKALGSGSPITDTALTTPLQDLSGGQRLPGRGFYEITGLAWTGGGVVKSVDVSVDGGRTYKEAQLQQPVLRYAHTRFRFAWEWDGSDTDVMDANTLPNVRMPNRDRFVGVELDWKPGQKRPLGFYPGK